MVSWSSQQERILPSSKGLLRLGALKLTVRGSIVAIHGLNGHREGTWTADNGTLWLRDLLPLDLPTARILTYGYDADTHSTEFTSSGTIIRHAENFFRALIRMRRGVERVRMNDLITIPSLCFSARLYSLHIVSGVSFLNRSVTRSEPTRC